MISKKILSFAWLLALVPVGGASASSSDVPAGSTGVAAAATRGDAAPTPLTASNDCSRGFFSRLVAAYREDAQPADSSTPAPARRGLDSPFSSPPFPSSEWQLGGVDYPIGVPDENS